MDTNNSHCSRTLNNIEYTFPTLLAISVAILIILSFTQHRVKLCKGCCHGVPGLVVPVSLLSFSQFRLLYAAIFGAMSSTLLSLLVTMQDQSHIETDSIAWGLIYQFVLYPLVLVVLLSLLFFPLFACVDSPIPLLGHALGLSYCCFIIAVFLQSDSITYTGCSELNQTLANFVIILNGVGNIPVYICYLIILIWYLYQLIKDIVRVCREGCISNVIDQSNSQYHDNYVKKLLRKQSPVRQDRGILKAVVSYICPYNRVFKFPLRFLGVVIVMFIILYELTFKIAAVCIYYGHELVDFWKDDGHSILTNLSGNFSEIDSFYDGGLEIVTAIAVVISLAPLVSLMLCLILLVHMVASVHKDFEKVAKEGFSSISKNLSPSFLLADSLQYAGLQIGFFVWAWFIYFGLSAVILSLATLLYFGLHYQIYYVKYVLGTILIGLGWTCVVLFAQVLLCKFVFLEKGSGKFLLIKNRRLFNWFSYVLLLYNALIGIVAALVRVLVSAGFGLLLLFRLDKVVLMKGLEFADFGHKAYKGFLYVEYTYNNAIVNVFVKLLGESIALKSPGLFDPFKVTSEAFGDLDHVPMLGISNSKRSYGSYPTAKTAQIHEHSQQARNRWLVAYTLLRNPSLLVLTGSSIGMQQPEEEQSVVRDHHNAV